MHRTLVLVENGSEIVRHSRDHNEYHGSGLEQDLKSFMTKIESKKQETWNWKQGLIDSFYSGFGYLRGNETVARTLETIIPLDEKKEEKNTNIRPATSGTGSD